MIKHYRPHYGWCSYVLTLTGKLVEPSAGAGVSIWRHSETKNLENEAAHNT